MPRRKDVAKVFRLHEQDDNLIFYDKDMDERHWRPTLDKNPIFETNDMKLWRAALITKIENEKKARMAPYIKTKKEPTSNPGPPLHSTDTAGAFPADTTLKIDMQPSTRVRTKLRKRGRISRVRGFVETEVEAKDDDEEVDNDQDDHDDNPYNANDDFMLSRKEIATLPSPSFDRIARGARRDAFDARFFPSCCFIFVMAVLSVVVIIGAGALGYYWARDDLDCGGGGGKCVMGG